MENSVESTCTSYIPKKLVGGEADAGRLGGWCTITALPIGHLLSDRVSPISHVEGVTEEVLTLVSHTTHAPVNTSGGVTDELAVGEELAAQQGRWAQTVRRHVRWVGLTRALFIGSELSLCSFSLYLMCFLHLQADEESDGVTDELAVVGEQLTAREARRKKSGRRVRWTGLTRALSSIISSFSTTSRTSLVRREEDVQ